MIPARLMPSRNAARKRADAAMALLMALLACLVFPFTAAPAAEGYLQAELVAEGPARPGATTTLAFVMTPRPGWHGYWLNPGDAGQGMQVEWTLPAGAKAGSLQYPVPSTYVLAGLMNHIYESRYAVLVPLTLPQNARPGDRLAIRVKARWLVCSDKLCVPESGELATTVSVGEGAGDPRFEEWRRALPAPLGAQAQFAMGARNLRIGIPLPRSVPLEEPHFFVSDDRLVDYAAAQAMSRKGDLLVIEIPRAKVAPLSPTTVSGVLRLNRAGDGVSIEADPGIVPAGGDPIARAKPSANAPIGLLLLGALAGGLLLNLMPCVFPILSLKALSLARAGESGARARTEGLAYTAGVVLACLGLGALLLALRAAGEEVGWAFQLQEPVVVAALLLLATAITANFAGLFEFALPGFTSQGSAQGAFATGLLAAFVATPCTGPFMAAAMGAALLLPVPQAMVLFGALGLGLALPFLLIAYVPRLRAMLPRPGAWMATFRKVMAVPMGLTALALAWLCWRLGGQTFALWVAGFALTLVLVLWLAGLRQRRGKAVGYELIGAVAAIVLLTLFDLPRAAQAPASAHQSVLPSTPFSEAALAQARAAGKPVFAYFTADWCLTCKINEAAAIEREETRAAFEKAGVVVLRGDWTRRDPAITRYLTAQGAAGVPLYMWYPAGDGDGQLLPQILTPAMLAELARP